MLEQRPAGQVRINDEGYVEFVPEGKWKPSKRWEDSPDGRRVAKFKRDCAARDRRRQLERVKAGLPSKPPKPKAPTRKERLANAYKNLEALNEIIPTVEKGGRAYRIMMRSLKDSMEVVKALEAGREPERRNGPIEQQAIR